VYAVRDWLNFQLINWPIFNLADSFLVCGAALLIWHAFRPQVHPSASREAGVPTSNSSSAPS
jgi:lipoprotein signal peptidase